jgi:hypothetical protein
MTIHYKHIPCRLQRFSSMAKLPDPASAGREVFTVRYTLKKGETVE